jgi:hypothetical protein
MNYGKAIPIDSSYQSLPEREFYDVLIDKVRGALIPQMVHIESADHDRIVRYLRQHRDKKDLVEQLAEDQRVVNSWEEVSKADVKPASINIVSMILAFPLHVYVWVNNILPHLLIHWLLNKYVTPEFRGSLKLGFGMVIVPLFYLLQSIGVQLIFSDWRVTLAYVVTLPFLSVWSVDLFKSATRKLY